MTTVRARTRSIRVGFHVPGIFAAMIRKSIENGMTNDEVMQSIAKLESCMHFQCTCALRVGPPTTVLTDAQKQELIELAQQGPYRVVYDRSEQIFRAIELQCPGCGQTHVLNLTDRDD